MKIAFYDTKPYDKTWFKPLAKEHGFDITFFETKLSKDTAIPVSYTHLRKRTE